MVSESAYMHIFSSTQPVYAMLGAFNPFPFKVIVNMCDPVTVFLFVLGLFFVSLFLLLCFLPREVPLAFVVKLISVQFNLVVLNSLNFCLFRKLLISPSNFIESPSW